MSSVFMALAADTWWQGRKDRSEELELLAGLRTEFLGNRQRLQEEASAVAAARDRLRWLAGAAQSSSAIDPDTTFGVGEVLSQIHRSYSTQLSDGFLTSTITSGKLGLIESPALRAALVETRSIEEDVAELQGWIGDLSNRGAVALARHPAVAGAYTSDRVVGERRISGETVLNLGADRELVAIVAAKANYWNGYLAELARLESHVDGVIVLLESALGGT